MEAIKSVTIDAIFQEFERFNRDAHQLAKTLQEIPEGEFDRDISVHIVDVLAAISAARSGMAQAQSNVAKMLLSYRSIRKYLVDFDCLYGLLHSHLSGCDVNPVDVENVAAESMDTLVASYQSTGMASMSRNIYMSGLPNDDEVLQLPVELTRSIGMAATHILAVIPSGVWQWKRLLDLPGYQLEITVGEVSQDVSREPKHLAIDDQSRRRRKPKAG